MRYAIIENNRVVNVAVSDSALFENWIQSDNAEIGDKYENGTFIKYDPLSDPEFLEKLSKEIRQARNLLLTASDWTQLPDALVDKQAWADYRQALRDIPQQAGFPTEINWPKEPQ